MKSQIELPGGVVADLGGPSVDDLILEQLKQVTIALNTVSGQLDMLMRLECGAVSKHEVRVRFEKNDAKIRAMQAVAQKSNTNKEGE